MLGSSWEKGEGQDGQSWALVRFGTASSTNGSRRLLLEEGLKRCMAHRATAAESHTRNLAGRGPGYGVRSRRSGRVWVGNDQGGPGLDTIGDGERAALPPCGRPVSAPAREWRTAARPSVASTR